VAGALSNVTLDDKFRKELAATMQPDASTLFVLGRRATPDKVAAEIEGTGGKILKTSLSHEKEAELQAVLNQARQSG
jgi:uncharacterized membrane protein